MMNAGLVTQERLGRNLVYRVSFDRVDELMGYLMANCCEGEASCLPTAQASCNC
jgi:ArsR family transcriptional regulator